MLTLDRRHGRVRRRPRRRRRLASTSPTARCSPCSGRRGCGKSTLLRAVAGLEPLDAGRDRRRTAHDLDRRADPQARLRADVPGRPALRPPDASPATSATPCGCAAGPPTAPGRRAARAGRARGVRRPPARPPCPAASGSGSRWPARWRCEPRLLLLDEPLSALDAALRERLAVDLREILRAAGTTALMVTHDHEEAFARRRPARGDARRRVVQSGPDRRRVGRAGRRRRPRCSSATRGCSPARPPRRLLARGRAARRRASGRRTPLGAGRRRGRPARRHRGLGAGDPGAGAAGRRRRWAGRARRRRAARQPPGHRASRCGCASTRPASPPIP